MAKTGTKWKSRERGKWDGHPRRDAIILFPREIESKKIILLAISLTSHDD